MGGTRCKVKRLLFRSDFDGGNMAEARLSLGSDGITEVYEVLVAPDCAGEWAWPARMRVRARAPGGAVAAARPFRADSLRALAQGPSTRPS